MNKFTLGTTYYNNKEYLERFIARNIEFVDQLIVVDDGSQHTPCDFLKPNSKISLYRVTKDYGFNSHGCRNLIAKEAINDNIILMDVDREFCYPKEAYDRLKSLKIKPNTVYKFLCFWLKENKHPHISVNDFLITKNHFFSVGGYDEEIIGQRWGDREFLQQLQHFGTEKILYDVLMINTRKSSSSLKGESLSPNDKIARPKHMRIVDNRIKTPEPNKPILTFEWERVF